MEELSFPHKTLERVVTQLQKELDNEKTDAGTGGEPPTAKGKSNWEQYREIFEAIVCSNGWDDVTVALQLLSHLDGDALNVAMLVPESQQAVPEFLINSLSEH